MAMPSIRQATTADRSAVISILTLAFSGDPVNRWYLADADRYLEYFPQVVAPFLDASLDAGTCYLSEGREGAAVWLPPGASVDEEVLQNVIAEAVTAQLMDAVGELFGSFESYHPHDDDCWYLPLIGVDAGHQGKGVGAALMKHVISLIDEQGALSYLESSTPNNVPLYQRHGFEVMDQIPFGDGDDVVTPMVRARS